MVLGDKSRERRSTKNAFSSLEIRRPAILAFIRKTSCLRHIWGPGGSLPPQVRVFGQPPVDLRPQLISSQSPSTARPSLRGHSTTSKEEVTGPDIPRRSPYQFPKIGHACYNH